MNHKTTALITSFVTIAVVLFVGGSVVSSQTVGFSEPGTLTESLPAPITTSSAAQSMITRFAVGVDSEDQVPTDATFFVQGSVSTQGGAYHTTPGVVIDATPDNIGDGTLFNLQGSHVAIGEACSVGRVCVEESNVIRPAVWVRQATGIGLFGETQAAGKSGIYAEGYYGIYARAEVKQAIAIVGRACTESKGACIAPYGTAGFFDGNFVVQKGLGVLTGDGRNLYRVATLYNMEEDHYVDKNSNGVYDADEEGQQTTEADRSDGVAYKSYGVLAGTEITLAGSGVDTIDNVVNTGERVVSVIAVEGDGTDFWPAKDVDVVYIADTNRISLSNTSLDTRHIQLLVSYIK